MFSFSDGTVQFERQRCSVWCDVYTYPPELFPPLCQRGLHFDEPVTVRIKLIPRVDPVFDEEFVQPFVPIKGDDLRKQKFCHLRMGWQFLFQMNYTTKEDRSMYKTKLETEHYDWRIMKLFHEQLKHEQKLKKDRVRHLKAVRMEIIADIKERYLSNITIPITCHEISVMPDLLLKSSITLVIATEISSET